MPVDIPTNRDGFYLVWRVGGPPPTYRHEEKADAVKEAERLAREKPGDRFLILQALTVVSVPLPPVETVELSDPEIPF